VNRGRLRTPIMRRRTALGLVALAFGVFFLFEAVSSEGHKLGRAVSSLEKSMLSRVRTVDTSVAPGSVVVLVNDTVARITGILYYGKGEPSFKSPNLQGVHGLVRLLYLSDSIVAFIAQISDTARVSSLESANYAVLEWTGAESDPVRLTLMRDPAPHQITQPRVFVSLQPSPLLLPVFPLEMTF